MSPVRRTIAVPDRVLVKELDGEAVLLDLARETYFGLNATAFRMWSALTASGSIDGGLAELLGEYEIDEDVLRDDLLRFVDLLETRGLIRVGHG